MAEHELAIAIQEHNGHTHEKADICVFCTIIEGGQSTYKVADSALSTSFLSLEGYPLIVPRKHIEQPQEDLEASTDSFRLATQLVPIVKSIYHVEGVNILANVGRDAGQAVNHFHIHLIPRIAGDHRARFRYDTVIDSEKFAMYSQKLQNAFKKHRP